MKSLLHSVSVFLFVIISFITNTCHATQSDINDGSQLNSIQEIKTNLSGEMSTMDGFPYLKSSDFVMADSNVSLISQIKGITCNVVAADGDYLYFTDLNKLRVVNIQDPVNPVTIKEFTYAYYVKDIVSQNDLIYVTVESDGLYIIDKKNPENITEVGHYFMGTAPSISGVTIAGNYAYVAFTYAGLMIIDVSQPSNPVLVNNYTYWGNHIENVFVKGDVAYLTDYEKGLDIVDVSDPANPVRIVFYETGGRNNYDIKIVGDTAYLADQSKGLYILDISNPAQPQQLGLISNGVSGLLWNIDVKDHYLYLPHSSTGLQIYDVRDPANPIQSGYFECGSTNDVSVQNDKIYLSGYNNGVYILRNDLLTGIENKNSVSKSQLKNYPNPFHTSTTISFSMVKEGFVTIEVFNINGQKVTTLLNEHKRAGTYKLQFDARDLPKGIYLYSLNIDGNKTTRKLQVY